VWIAQAFPCHISGTEQPPGQFAIQQRLSTSMIPPHMSLSFVVLFNLQSRSFSEMHQPSLLSVSSVLVWLSIQPFSKTFQRLGKFAKTFQRLGKSLPVATNLVNILEHEEIAH
jgi:hypothetical protein